MIRAVTTVMKARLPASEVRESLKVEKPALQKAETAWKIAT